MRRNIALIVCISMFMAVICGCGKQDGGNETGDYLGELQNNYNPETLNDDKELFPMPSMILSQVYITDKENSVVNERTMVYSGERMEYKLITSIYQEKEDGPKQFDRVFFILVDGYLQPFYFEDSDKPVLYASIEQESSNELKDYDFAFEPIYVPYGENAALSFVIASTPVYYQESPSEMIYNDIQSYNFCITAQSESCAVSYEKAELPADAVSDYVPTGGESNGMLVLAEKLERSEQLNINTLIETDEQLYATIIGSTVLTDEDKDIRIYCVADGELLPVFKDNYYTDLSMQKMVPYQVPLDMDKLSKGEKHLIYFISIKKNEIKKIQNITDDDFMLEPFVRGLNITYCVEVK